MSMVGMAASAMAAAPPPATAVIAEVSRGRAWAAAINHDVIDLPTATEAFPTQASPRPSPGRVSGTHRRQRRRWDADTKNSSIMCRFMGPAAWTFCVRHVRDRSAALARSGPVPAGKTCRSDETDYNRCRVAMRFVPRTAIYRPSASVVGALLAPTGCGVVSGAPAPI